MTMQRVLIAVGLLYGLSGMWCAIRPLLAAEYVGYSLTSPVGIGEFVSVYGGLQLGLAAAMLTLAGQATAIRHGLLFSAIFSSVLAFVRVVSLLIYGYSEAHIGFFILEAVLALVLVAAYIKCPEC